MRRRVFAAALSALWLASGGALPQARADATGYHEHRSDSEGEARLDRVEVSGVTVFSSDLIQGAVEIGPGDLLNRAKIIATVENIQALYKLHGYEEATVEPRLSGKRVLEFVVHEGNPTRIAEIDFQAEPETGEYPASQEVWAKLQRVLKTGIGIESGDPLDQEKLTSAKRAVIELLASEEYVGAKVQEIGETVAGAPPGWAASKKPAGKWVRLQFFVQLGDRVSFGFRGNHVVSTSRLSAIIDEQRTLGLGQDFVSAIRAKIEDEYHSLGYARVRVTAYTFERPASGERHVTYDIEEGPRVSIDSVQFDGNSVFSSEELRKRFFDLAPELVQHGYYVEKDVQRAADLLVEWMKSKGYLGAKLVTINTSYVPRRREDEQGTRVKLVIYIYESEQTIVQGIHISGGTALSRAEIEKKLSIREGQPLNVFAFGEGIEALKAAYRAKGYLGVAIANEGTDKVIRYSDENRLADVFIDINEGPQYRVSRILVEGLQKTKEKVVLREMRVREGDIASEPKLIESEARLRKLGIFSSVTVTAMEDPDNPSGKIVKVSVSEADPGIVAGGPGFRNDLGVRAFTQVGYSDLWGDDHSVFLNAAVNRRVDSTYRFMEYQTQLAYEWPWFADSDVKFRPSLNLSGTEYLNFDAVTADLNLNWERRLLDDPNLTGMFSYDIERVHQFDAASSVDDGLFLIGSVTPSLQIDMRDNPLAPTRGLFSSASFEFASPYLGSQRSIGYWRLQTRSDYTIPLAPNTTWYWSVRTGFEKSTASYAGSTAGYGAIPLIKQFALGGIGSMRGFYDEELNVQNEAITGTLSYVNYRTQIDLPISGALHFGPFLDAGNLNVDKFSFGGLVYGSGVGMRYDTPVGPVNLDYGFRIDPPAGVPRGEFYFSIGVL